MSVLGALDTKRYEIPSRIIAQAAPRQNVMVLKIIHSLWFAKTLSVCIFNSLDHCYSQPDCDTSRPCSPSLRS
jgi:hypothetical protein